MAKLRIDRTLYLVGVIILTALVGYFVLDVYERELEAMPVLGPITEDDQGNAQYHRVPPFSFTDQNGDTFGSEDLNGKIYVANYFFTSCPTICPQMSGNLKTLHQRLADKPFLEILSFTVDPERDSPERLLMYAKKFEADAEQWHFLTGEKPDLYWLARNGYFLSATEGDGGPLDFIHSENLVLVDQEGRIRAYYDGTKPASVDQLVNDIQKLRKANS